MRADVAVVGCGPTGGTLANLLGLFGLTVVVIERDREVFPVPRATHLDEETLRNLGATGLLDLVLPFTEPFGTFSVVDHHGRVLLQDVVEAREPDAGFHGSRFFDQPALERVLREGLGRFPGVRLLEGVAATVVEDLGDRARVRARDADGDEVVVEAAWVVGCDGGRSLARDVVGGDMDELAPARRWAIVDAVLDPDDPPPLPAGFRYVLDPERLTLYAHGFGRSRRWEFRLRDDEPDPTAEEAARWVARYADVDRLRVVRATTYTQRALVARRWRAGRVLLAGDAAHLMPPFAGQGMCSGIRDAVDLAWKLAWVVQGRASVGLLDTYEAERRAHVREVTLGALFLGDRLDATTGPERALRWAVVRGLGAWAGLRERVRTLAVRRPPVTTGLVAGAGPGRGELLPSVPLDGDVRFDDLVGYRGVLLADAPTAVDTAWAAARGFVPVRPSDHPALAAWLAERRADVALVRPDRHVFGVAPSAGLSALCAAFDAGTRPAVRASAAARPSRGAAPPAP